MSGRHGLIALGRDIDAEAWERDVAAGERPRHYAIDLAHLTGMELVTAASVTPRLVDRLAARMIGSPTSWAVARSVSKKTEPTEFVYATDEAIGIPLILLSRHRRSRAESFAMFVMAPQRPKTRVWLRLLKACDLLPALLVVGAAETERRLVDSLGEETRPILQIPVVVDDRFFSPGPRDATEPPRPALVVSAGLEQRDYVRFAEAVASLEVEVVVCAMSPDAAGGTTTPVQIPPNMRFEPMSIRELRDLYRRADLFVLSTHQNELAAGLTAVMEALACGTPVVASVGRSDLAELGRDGLIDIVEDPSPGALRHAIERALDEPTNETNVARKRLSADELTEWLETRFRDADLLAPIDRSRP
jgi:glycosyltransferase involved in cell wall biosynthesis